MVKIKNFKTDKPPSVLHKAAYMGVFGNFDQVLHSCLQLIASHSGDHYSIQLGCQLPHVLLIRVHHTLKKRTSVLTAECTESSEI